MFKVYQMAGAGAVAVVCRSFYDFPPTGGFYERFTARNRVAVVKETRVIVTDIIVYCLTERRKKCKRH